MKCTLHFATKLNSRDIQKCNWFWVPSCVMFAYRKAVFPAPMATGVHRLRNKWLSLLSLLVNNYCDKQSWSHATATGGRGYGGEVICYKKVPKQSILNQSLDPLPQSKTLGSAPVVVRNQVRWVHLQAKLFVDQYATAWNCPWFWTSKEWF